MTASSLKGSQIPPPTLFLAYFRRHHPFNPLILSKILKRHIVKSVNREALFSGFFALKSP
jgi:hypothetical protein